MKSLIFIEVFFLLCISFFVSEMLGKAILPGEGNGGNYPESLNLIGESDGKEFYFDKSYKNWTEASQHCRDMGMRLAAISTPKQARFLNESYGYVGGNGDSFRGGYWTSGRDSQELRQFSWDFEANPPDSSYIELRYIYGPYRTCLFYASDDGDSYLASHSCSIQSYVLCERSIKQ